MSPIDPSGPIDDLLMPKYKSTSFWQDATPAHNVNADRVAFAAEVRALMGLLLNRSCAKASAAASQSSVFPYLLGISRASTFEGAVLTFCAQFSVAYTFFKFEQRLVRSAPPLDSDSPVLSGVPDPLGGRRVVGGNIRPDESVSYFNGL